MILCIFALLCLGAGAFKRLPIYDLFVEGAKTGLKTAVSILPPLMVTLGAVKGLEVSGITGAFCTFLSPLMEKIGLPAPLLPLMLMRPVSGSGALAILRDLMDTHGPDSHIALLAGVMMGSSETVLYTCTVYLGAAGVKKSGYIIPCALMACLAGYVGALLFCP